jgi:hypothetical protein
MVQTLSIRTKLIVAMLALVASVALMGMTADDANAQVTEIRWVENHTRFPVYVKNHETKARMLVPPYSARSVNQRIPWVIDNTPPVTDFDRGHYIELGYSYPYAENKLPRFAIWQEGDRVRYTKAKGTGLGEFYLNYDPKASPISGNSSTGGRRILIITFTGWEITSSGVAVPRMGASLCQPCP